MSTKHYNGLKLPKMSMYETMQFFKKLRADFEEVAKTHYYNQIFNYATGQLDRAVIHGDIPDIDGRSVFLHHAYRIREWGREAAEGSRMPWGDYGLEYIIYPLEDKTLATVFSEQFSDWACEYPGFEEWSWWNNTDCPQGISEEEWNQREEDWSNAYDEYEGRARPVDHGFSFQVHGPVADWATFSVLTQSIRGEDYSMPVRPEDYNLSHVDRVKERAQEDVLDEHFEDSDLKGSEIARAARKYKKTLEYSEDVEARLHTFKALLPESYPDEAYINTKEWFKENYD